jgi:lactate dehydrogenase-like 2-hydroxyacid dehydrogenase
MTHTKPRILLTRQMPPNVEDRLTRDFEATLNVNDRIYSSDEIIEIAKGHEGILCCGGDDFSEEVIAALPESVKIVATYSVGYEHIDITAAKRRGLVVTNTPDVLTDATADIAMLCLLGAARRAAEGNRLVQTGGWSGWSSTMLLGVHVTGKRIGIFGMGRIGRALAQRARGFGMTIHYHNRSRLSEELEQGAIYHEKPESLLAVSEFFAITALSSKQTYKFLNTEHIALLPDGAVISNTSRGSIIDDDALITALKSGKVAAAGLDVFEGEPNINPGYRSVDNIFMLPHLGSATYETRDVMGFCCLDNLDAYFEGRPCPTSLT